VLMRRPPYPRILAGPDGYVRRMDERASLEDLFERFESLPSRDEEQAKRELVDRMLAAVADRLAATDADDERYRDVRDASARVRLLAPGADGFDEAVLRLIDAVREAFGGERLAEVLSTRAPERQEGAEVEGAEVEGDSVTGASQDSFPASDPPGYVAGGEGSR
jgi:hypothetical protein